MATLPSVKDLLEAGVHFGHQTKRWNPKMREFIFTQKNDIHIIDLSKTLINLEEAVNFLESKVSSGGSILFVGTKRQAQEVVEDIAKRTGVFYVTNRWVGGLLTNFSITKKNINKMIELQMGMEKGFENRTKQEISLMGKELERLERLYGGIKGLMGKPSVIVLADPHHERIAVKEAQKLGIPVIGVVDTNCDPDEVTYAIPGNDDAIKSISLFFNLFAQVIDDAKKNIASKEEKVEVPAEKTEKKTEPKKDTKEKKAVVKTKADTKKTKAKNS